MIAQFRDGTLGPVTDVHWSPAFTTALVTRHDGKKRCVFWDRGGMHRDAWVLRLVEVKPTVAGLVA